MTDWASSIPYPDENWPMSEALMKGRAAAHASRSAQPYDIDARWADEEAGEAAIRAYLAALPLPAAGEGLEPVAWQPGEQGLAVQALINLLAKLSTSPDNADYCLWLERIVAVLTATQAARAAVLPNWFDQIPDTWELSHGEADNADEGDPLVWRVHERSGNRSDREWTELATGTTPTLALRAALKEKT